MKSQYKIRIVLAVLMTISLLTLSGSVRAEDYVIGAEDQLSITFWQDPSLNTIVRVDIGGKISLDIVGQVQAGGKTTSQLQNEIVRLISRLNNNISQATVRVIQYNYNYLFVVGQVNEPGKKSFEVIPDLWTIINEAGGLAEFGDLSRVTIIRGGAAAGEVEVVDVRKAMAEGRLNQLPKVRRGDTVEIGRNPGQILAGEIGQMTEKKNLFYVVGEVTTPGPVAYEANIDVMEALALAGGPTESADLKKVRLVMKDGNFAQTAELDLDQYAQTGGLARYIMQKEDLVVVPVRQGGFFDTTIGRVATILTAISTAYLLVDRVTTQ